MRPNRHAVGALAAVTTLLVGGAGAALASSGDGDRSARCEERLAEFAREHGVTVAQLTADLKARLLARIDAAEKAGRISKEHATKLRERIAAAAPCADAREHTGARFVVSGMLKPAAEFLGLDKAQLRAQLPGTSLAALAHQQGKSVEALEAAMAAPGKARLAKAVANGRITHARADRLAAKLERAAHRLATKVFPSK
jgi:hypothetical protein